MSSGGFLLTLGIIIYIGVIGSYIFQRYRIPDVLNLIFIGFLLGPVLHFIDPGNLAPWMPIVGAIALGLILFEGGLDLDFDQILSRFGFSFTMATASFFFSMAAIAGIYRAVVHAPWTECLLLGSVLGCVSSAVIVPISTHLRVPEEVKTSINLEAALSDMWGVVLTLVLLRVSNLSFDPGHTVNAVIGSFTTALVGAGVFGMVWLWALERLRLGENPFSYMMTLAAVFVLYGLTELAHGSGPMAALAFGVVLTNAKEIAAVFGKSFKFYLDDKIRAFNTEVTFFARTFYFVYLGLVVSLKTFSLEFLMVSAAIFAAILACRYVPLRAAALYSKQEAVHLWTYLAMVPRGLTSAVLAGVVHVRGIGGGEFLEYAFSTILLTNVLMTWMVYRAEKPPQPAGSPASKA